ncbi:MAG: tRNA uridine-5-carboxymethylaminomethyl(34) synthesis GTPase MnmE [Sinobacteraceae bacterium]|nr:tRNA uridine-5-carboxymethylaminomethyl(34) synthesis GTPase MnmE [Nevskiaceae bacterium]
MSSAATIVAIATAAGRGGVGIVRLSGSMSRHIGESILGKSLPPPRQAVLAGFRDEAGAMLDEGLVLFFPAPHSYTGEDVLELHGHGGKMVLEALVARAVDLGARRASPGEFTQRAFLNDKLDLAQAEAVADLIDAGSLAAARAALRSLQGEFSAAVRDLVEALIELRVWVEAAIDFPEEEIDFLADRALVARLDALRARFAAVLRSARQGRVLRDGMTVVIAGRPNAGKSSLLNALAGHEAAIVTPLAGTTRDVLREQIAIDGMPLHVIDTAGLRAADEAAADVVEAEGIRRARVELARADRILFVIDAVADPSAEAYRQERASLPPEVPVTLLINKLDQVDETRAKAEIDPAATDAPAVFGISARTRAGLDALRQHLKDCMGYEAAGEGAVSARARHIEALQRAERHAETAFQQLTESRAGELVAEELRLAQAALGEITGEFRADDLLGRIFGSFCIGK